MVSKRGNWVGKGTLILLILLIGTVFVFSCTEKTKEESQTEVKPTPKPKPENPFKQTVSLEEYPAWVKQYSDSRVWSTHDRSPRLNRQILLESLELGRTFMVNNQKPEGNYNYQYDFVTKQQDKDDNQVRQAGALWGLALLYQYKQDPKNKIALDKGLKFFFEHTKPGPVDGTLAVAYPGEANCSSGTVALVALSIIEYLRTDNDAKIGLPVKYKKELKSKLDGYISFLKWLRLDNLHFSRDYSLLTKTKKNRFSPYFDGETMLCLIKASKYLDYKDLVPFIEESAMVLAKEYTIDEWVKNPDSDQTKGFFQWSCMTYWEYFDAGYKNAETFGDYVLGMGWWMLHTHKTLTRSRNTAYAYEGILSAYKVAVTRKNEAAISDLFYTIDKGLYKLTSWQVGGPLMNKNPFLMDHPTTDPLAVGGIMNHKRKAPLRIDVTQHQMHAVIMALKNAYPADATKLATP